MRRISASRPVPLLFVAVVIVLATGVEAFGIEMFTFFGDGSRIGLPSLEVPVEAYPGIPLRSDRIRMRRGRFGQRRGGLPAANRMAPSAGVMPKIAEPIPEPRSGGVRIRPMEAEPRAMPIAPMPPE